MRGISRVDLPSLTRSDISYVLSCGAARALGVQNLQIADCACALVGYARDALPIA